MDRLYALKALEYKVGQSIPNVRWEPGASAALIALREATGERQSPRPAFKIIRTTEPNVGWLKMQVNFLLFAMRSACSSCSAPWAWGIGIAAAFKRKQHS